MRFHRSLRQLALASALGTVVLVTGSCSSSDDAAETSSSAESVAASAAVETSAESSTETNTETNGASDTTEAQTSDLTTPVDAGSSVATPPVSLRIVASFYPLAYLAQTIGGAAVNIEDLTPPGVEAHDLELSLDQAASIEDADVVFAIGQGFQPSVEAAMAKRPAGKVNLLDAVVEGADGTTDPHLWLDPVTFVAAAEVVRDALSASAPEAAPMFASNTDALLARLNELNDSYASTLRNCASTVIVSSHDAFGRLAARYGLTTEGIAGISPDAEPTPGRLDELADLVSEKGITTVFTEELVSPAIAETLAREAKVKTSVLLTIETKPETGDYLDAMRTNLSTLKDGLGC